ncbi:hypothetical protein E2562_003135 [Oryza meyeriana var. granulata]|uniref:Lipase n=1 Tax=Oryza meyeriana var. granulata TaxID=110450 RepID=A0A6G1E9T2_9ORYZ|nr:hypothetical protein E2562_003135 [Oryza meyeriana var. granulata]
MAGPGGVLALILLIVSCFYCCRGVSGASPAADALRRVAPRAGSGGLCEQLLLPLVYPCTEHTVETKDGFLLSLQHIPHGKNKAADSTGPPVFLQHGLFQGGDTWFINSAEQSLGYILADNGFDVWIGNVRGTRWSKGHSTFSVHDKLFWDWSWQELAEYDLLAMLGYVYTVTKSKISYVGHSQGTIMGLAALTMPEIVKMMLLTMGIHQLNFRSDMGVQIVDSLCDGEHVDCNNLLSAITGENCCFNTSRIDFYLEYEPHPSSTKNLHHLFQMIRKGTFTKYDYGLLGNLRRYGHLRPPRFDLSSIPESLPIWMGYGGLDALADVTDVQRTIRELKSTPELLYIGDYGHIDFVMSVKAKDDAYVDLIRFLRENGWHSSY